MKKKKKMEIQIKTEVLDSFQEEEREIELPALEMEDDRSYQEKDPLEIDIMKIKNKQVISGEFSSYEIKKNNVDEAVTVKNNSENLDEENKMLTPEIQEKQDYIVSDFCSVSTNLADSSFENYNKDDSQPSNFMLRMDKSNAKHTCEFCQKTFAAASYLIRHLRIHSGEKPYNCNVCNKSFAQTSHLNKHVRTHSGEKPYVCELCHNSFSTLCSLKRHVQSHSGQKLYSCEFCEKSFSRSNNLNAHIRLHTGQRPFICEYCNKSFSQSSYLNKHMRTHIEQFNLELIWNQYRD